MFAAPWPISARFGRWRVLWAASAAAVAISESSDPTTASAPAVARALAPCVSRSWSAPVEKSGASAAGIDIEPGMAPTSAPSRAEGKTVAITW
jgi:hypothetical protein